LGLLTVVYLNDDVMFDNLVPSPPRGLQLSLTQEDPPVVTLTWSPPRHAHGSIEGYKLLYGVKGDYTVEERRFDGDKMRFTTGFLGIVSCSCFHAIIPVESSF
jgi:hypothetical protein